MLQLEVIITCAVVMLLLILALKYYPVIFPKPPNEPTAQMAVSEIATLTSIGVTSSSTPYHLTRPTPASKLPPLSPIREESRQSIGDTNASLPQSPMVLTSLVSPSTACARQRQRC